MDIAIMVKLLVATWLSCLIYAVRSASLRATRSTETLPIFRRPLPLSDDLSREAWDEALSNEFPGQFFTNKQIDVINARALQGRRRRRALDQDLCCKTNLWFGVAPTTIVDATLGKNWTVVRGGELKQAFSRGECHDNNRNTESPCPAGGKCRQKHRLHTLWVYNGTETVKLFFNIRSHCAYEQVGTAR